MVINGGGRCLISCAGSGLRGKDWALELPLWKPAHMFFE